MMDHPPGMQDVKQGTSKVFNPHRYPEGSLFVGNPATQRWLDDDSSSSCTNLLDLDDEAETTEQAANRVHKGILHIGIKESTMGNVRMYTRQAGDTLVADVVKYIINKNPHKSLDVHRILSREMV
jgi:hypothetical protein